MCTEEIHDAADDNNITQQYDLHNKNNKIVNIMNT